MAADSIHSPQCPRREEPSCLAGPSYLGGAGSYTSASSTDLYDVDYDIGERAEVVIEVVATALTPWSSCGPVPGLRYLHCFGVGTTTIDVALGTGSFSTGVKPPCMTDTTTFTLTERFSILGPLDPGEQVIFTLRLKWCWSGTRILSVVKEAPTWYTSGIFDDPGITRNVELVGTDNPYIENSSLPEAGRYHAEFLVTFQGTDIDGAWTQKDRVQIDRTYLAGGAKERDDKLLSFTVSRP